MTIADKIPDSNPRTFEVRDGFSLRRVGELYAYHRPAISRQCLIYLAVSLLCAVILLIPASPVVQGGLFAAVWSLIPLMFYIAPCVFGRNGDSPIIERLIPARPSEKMTFYLTYLLIIIPAILYLPLLASRWIYMHAPSLQTDELLDMYTVQIHNPIVLQGINILSGCVSMLICLYVVKRSRTNRILKGVMAVIAMGFVISIFGAIYGMYAVFSTGFNDAGMHGNPEEINPEFITGVINRMTHATGYLTLFYSFLVVAIGVLLWLIYRTLSRRNL